MAQVTLTIKLDLPALNKELQDAVNKIKAKLSEVGDVNIDFDIKDLQRDLDKVKKQTDGLGESGQKTNETFRGIGKTLLGWIGIATLVRSAFTFLIDVKNVARDAAEIQSKFDTVFSHLKAEANAWAENFGNSVGRAKSDVKSWMAELQDTFVPLGYTRTKAMELSESLVKLAVDVASFNNASDPEVIRDFTSALVGNHETVRKYGILITENSLKQEAENEGLNKKYDQLSELEKVNLRYNIILKSTTDAQGDAIRTADSLANTEKRNAAELKNLQEKLGKELIPIMIEFNKTISDLMSGFIALNDAIKSFSGEGILGGAVRVLKNFNTMGIDFKGVLGIDMIKSAQIEYRRLMTASKEYFEKNRENFRMNKWFLDQTKLEGVMGFDPSKPFEALNKDNKVTNSIKAVKESTENAYQFLMNMDKQMSDNEAKVNAQRLKYDQDAIKGLRLHKSEREKFIESWKRGADELAENEQRRLQSLTQAYQQHFSFIINAAMSSTDSQRSFAKQLQTYMLQLLKQYLVNFAATKLAEKVLHAETEAEKTAATEIGVAARMGLMVMEIAKSLATAAASIVQAIASGIAWLFATLGPFAIPAVGALAATAIGIFNGIKKTLGFKIGGYTGSGDADEIAGPAHKGEYIFEKNLVDKEPDNYEILHQLLRAGYTVADVMLGIKRYTNPIIEPTTALAGVNFGSVTPTISSGSGFSSKIESLLQSMDDRLRKIEEKEFELKGDLVAETKLRDADLAISVRRGDKQLNKRKANG